MPESFPTTFGRYQLLERLAVGGMAELFLANVSGAHGFERTIVIKRLLPHMLEDAQFITMFIDEAKLTAQLVHPKIAQTYELGKHGDQLFIAMEFVDGIDVLSMLRECAYRRIRIPPEVAVYITHEILDALDFAHNARDGDGNPMGIVHRDISPSNVLLSKRGSIKVIDFGIARAAEQHHQTQAGTLKGKYGYMSPEQVIGANFDARSDLFSVGVVLAEMLTGRRLFAAQNELDVLLMVRDAKLDRLERFGEHIHDGLKEILHKALQKDTSARYANASEFRDVLDEWMFANRHRVTPSAVAQIVETLYEDAWNRKRRALEADACGSSDAKVSQAIGIVAGESQQSSSYQAPQVPSYQAEIAGIPAGSMHMMESMPIVSIETDPDLDISVAPMQELDISVVPPQELDISAAPPQEVIASSPNVSFQQESSASPWQGGPSVPPPGTNTGIHANSLGSEASRGYSSMKRVASMALDPAARDFDDSMVSGREPSARAGGPVPSGVQFAEPSVPVPPKLETIVDIPADSGDLGDHAPIGVLYGLFSAGATGLLVVNCGAIRKEIYLTEGKPVFVTSNVASELFGEYLVKRRAISSGELAMALAMMPHYGGKLGDTLVGLGLMKPLEVFRTLTDQVSDKLIDVCTWSRGSYAWYGGRENPREAFPLDLDGYKLLGAGGMLIPPSRIESWVNQYADEKPKSVKNDSLHPEDFHIGAMVRDVYNSLTGRQTVGELANRYTDTDDRLQFLRVLFLLFHTNLATF